MGAKVHLLQLWRHWHFVPQAELASEAMPSLPPKSPGTETSRSMHILEW